MTNTQDRLYANLAASLGIDAALFSTPGTSIINAADRDADDWQGLWHFDAHVFVRAHAEHVPRYEAVLADKSAAHRLTAAEVQAAYPGTRISRERRYVLDPARYRHVAAPAPYTNRQLHPANQPAFAAFLARCPADDVDTADISIDPDIGVSFAVFHGAAIVAGASTYPYQGFADVGVLCDPAHRRRGLGKAVVAAVCEHFRDKDDLLLYRHEYDNPGSQGVARGLDLWAFTRIDYVKFAT